MQPSLLPRLCLLSALLVGAWNFANAQTHYVWADVVGVESIGTPYQECSRHSPPRRQANPVAAVVGGLLGGLLGNQLGGGSGKAAFTVAGAMAGAALAGRSRQPEPGHCLSSRAAHEYRVWYRYHGQEFSKRVPEYPGERILVAVDVEPVASVAAR